MHVTNLLNKLIILNNIDYVLYHCNCPQLDQLRIINKHSKFIHYPHYIDTNIFKKYQKQKKYDFVLYGCTTNNVYPFRNRLYTLILANKQFRTLYIPFPGYNINKKNGRIVMGEKLSQAINQAYIGIVTTSIHDYFIKKYLEVPASYCMIAGNLPSRDGMFLKDKIIELNPLMSDRQIITRLTLALSNKEELLEKTEILHNLIINNFNFENGAKKFVEFCESV